MKRWQKYWHHSENLPDRHILVRCRVIFDYRLKEFLDGFEGLLLFLGFIQGYADSV